MAVIEHKNLLTIANIEHASPRIPHFLYYLADYGWHPTLLTPHWDNSMVEKLGLPQDFTHKVSVEVATYKGDSLQWIRTILFKLGLKKNQSLTEQVREKSVGSSKTSFFHRLLYAYQSLFAFPDTEKTWIAPCIKRAITLSKHIHFDALLSSSPFGSTHVIAHHVQKKIGMPWVADFRDPWVLNHDYPFNKLRFLIEREYEKKIIAPARALTTAWPACTRRQHQLHNQPTHTIYNGFDPAALPPTAATLPSKLTLSFTGTIYDGKQKPELLLEALAALQKKHPNTPLNTLISVSFYGRKNARLEGLINSYDLNDVVHYGGMLSRTKTLAVQRESHALILFGWEDENEKGIFQTKLFEYLAAHRPILWCGGPPDEESKEVVRTAHAGSCAPTTGDIEKTLEELMSEFKKTGTIAYHGNEEKIMQFSYPHLAQKLHEVLSSVIN